MHLTRPSTHLAGLLAASLLLAVACADTADPPGAPLVPAAAAAAGDVFPESPYLYGIHDHDTGPQEYMDRIAAGGATGWLTATIAIGSDPNNTGGDNFTQWSNQGHTVIVRLNHGYCGEGTIPTPDRYDGFARRAANYVSASQGAHIWVIGNETNLAGEWPNANGRKSYVSPQDYATLFRKVYDAIKAVRPDDKVVSQALAPFAGPYGEGSACGYPHDGNPINWVQYLNQMLTAIESTGGIDGIALHINSRGYTQGAIHSTAKMSAGGQSLYSSFYVYKDWVDFGIPQSLYHLPLYATESNGIYYWSGNHPESPSSHYEPGWMQEIYAEINRYNQAAATSGKPIYRSVNMYRWCAWCDDWNIDNSPYKGQILSDLEQAVAAGYTWPAGGDDGGGDDPTVPEGDNVALTTVAWAASSSFNGSFGGDKAYDNVRTPSSKWTSDGSGAESWLAFDLGADHDVTGFIVRHAGAAGEPQIYNTQAYRVESGTSLNGPWTPLASVNNAAQADANITILTAPVTARWVRLYITDAGTDNYARIPEFEVYGAPAPVDPPDGNVALGTVSWTASSSFNASFGGDKAYDGVASAASKWTSNGSSAESWLALDLGRNYDITTFAVRHAGAGGEAAMYNTQAYRLESGTSANGPWTTLATVDNGGQDDSNVTELPAAATARWVRLYITDAGIDNYARIPEFEVYGTETPVVPGDDNLIHNGDFANGLTWWTGWNQRGSLTPEVIGGAVRLRSSNHNGGVYQQFNTGGAGAEVHIAGTWATDPGVANTQWAEVLVINGSRLPQNGADVHDGQSDVVMIYKNDTWASPGGWSGSFAETSPVASAGSFVAAGDVATIILKSGNGGGTVTGTRYDDVVVSSNTPPPVDNQAPTAVVSATPTDGEAPLTVSFEGSASSDPDGDALTFSWTFGDGASTATGATASHTYAAAGSFSATLTVDDGNGATATATTTITVGEPPPPPPPSGDLLENTSFESGGTAVADGWTAFATAGFGAVHVVATDQAHDGSRSQAVQSPQPGDANRHAGVYQVAATTPGTVYTIGAWARTHFPGGNSWDHIARLGIDRAGGTDFTAAEVEWYEFSSDKDVWQEIERSFTATGPATTIYLQSWRKWAAGGGSQTWFDQVTMTGDGIDPPPPPGDGSPPTAFATASATGGIAPLAVSFDATASSDPDNDPLSFSWDFGDGSTAAGPNVSHTYTQAGTHVATLTVSDGKDGSDDFSMVISVTSEFIEMPHYCPAALNFPAIRQELNAQGQDLAHVKIGFHTGPGGNAQGLGDWMRCLDAAQVPFFLKSADAAGSIWEGATVKRASGVPHTLIYRRSSGNGWNSDVPDYNAPAQQEAERHWNRSRSEFPPELEEFKNIIWVESINEVDKNRSEWLAEFSYHQALIAMEQGFNYAAFGWSSGEPEREHWEGPWMQQFLELAANNPDRVAIALHEYSYVLDNVDRFYPNLVGRFQMLYDVADASGFRRPNVVVTEWGWVYDDVPSPAQAVGVDIPWASALYAQYPEFLGAAIWYLGPGFGGIANAAQQLIAPLTEYALQNYFIIPLH